MILIHPAAAAEARAARLRFAERDPAVAERFLAEYDRAIARVSDGPERWPRYPHLDGAYRWCRVRRFPYAVIYEVLPEVTHVLAVAADRRRPGSWADRK
ncbi:MAG: type II toxin-antitoxin system RelE/ParE family toxin [Deltaproteobacteria bacterium]|nr:type II toxin-antitoxin system RelE/ParE family toxin [Deltaproteobacteria bacterium]